MARIASTSEGQDLLDKIPRPLRTSADSGQIARQSRVRADMLFHHLGMTENPAQYVVKVVSDAARQRADLLHPLRLPQPPFEPRPFRFDGLPLDRLYDGIERHAHEPESGWRCDTTRPANQVKTKRDAGAV